MREVRNMIVKAIAGYLGKRLWKKVTNVVAIAGAAALQPGVLDTFPEWSQSWIVLAWGALVVLSRERRDIIENLKQK